MKFDTRFCGFFFLRLMYNVSNEACNMAYSCFLFFFIIIKWTLLLPVSHQNYKKGYIKSHQNTRKAPQSLVSVSKSTTVLYKSLEHLLLHRAVSPPPPFSMSRL